MQPKITDWRLYLGNKREPYLQYLRYAEALKTQYGELLDRARKPLTWRMKKIKRG